MIKTTQRTSKNAGNVFIGFDNLTNPKPFYVFSQDGEAFASNTEAGSWYGAVVPTGKEIGRFDTLREAQAKHPNASVTKDAKDASEYYG